MSGNFSDDIGLQCDTNSSDWKTLLVLPLPVGSLILNIFLFVAASKNRRKLQRQNYIFACVTSTLASNVLYLLFQVWILIDNFVSPVYEPRIGEKIWIICQTAVVSTQFIMCGNIGALLFVVLDSTYFVGRSVNRKASEFAKEFVSDIEGVRNRKWFLSAKRRRAILLIALSWLIPFFLTVVASVWWNCLDRCIFCSGGYAFGDVCLPGRQCSRIWPPVSNHYLAVNFGLWALELLGLVWIIVSGLRSFRQVMSPTLQQENDTKTNGNPPAVKIDSTSDTSAKNNNESQLHDNESNAYDDNKGEIDSDSHPSEIKKDEQVDETFDIGLAPRSRTLTFENTYRDQNDVMKKRRFATFKIHSRIKFMIVITVTFFVCTVPMLISFLLDVAGQFVILYNAALISSTVALYIYTIACPVILMKYLPNLRSAMIVMFRNCSCSRIKNNHRNRSQIRNQSGTCPAK